MKPIHALALLPLLIGVATQAFRQWVPVPAATPAARPAGAMGVAASIRATTKKAAPKQFSVSLSNLKAWAGAVVAKLDGVQIEGHSPVHNLDNDCEMHLGAHAPGAFAGDPDGLVLEPMNACVQPFPGKSDQSNADWTHFGDQITNTTVSAMGVPRIWPEHLNGGAASNPDHAVELHPLTSLVTADGKTLDFSKNIFAGEYQGGVGETTALAIVKNTSVSVTANGANADISFVSGTIGNFTVLEVSIDPSSIQSDGAGSYRMNGEVAVDDSTSVPVSLVTVKGSPINDDMPGIKSKNRSTFTLEALILFSLDPRALLAAANKSSGDAVAVERPLQLIVYGTPDTQQ